MDNPRLLDRIESGELSVEHDFNDLKVHVEVEACDQLGVLIRQVRLEAPLRRGSIPEQARSLSEKLTYLGGSLKIIEMDNVSNAALMRSQASRKDGYIEVILRGGNAVTLEKRPSGSLHLSKRDFERLIIDLAGIF